METIDRLDAKNPLVEAYRSIRTSIEYSNLDKKLKVILITSTQQNEGKSTIVSNLALSFSNLQNKKVLLVDGDLRNPSLHRIFNVSNLSGVMDALKDDKPVSELVYKFNEDKLDVLMTGTIPPNPDEVIGTNRMKRFIEELKEDYDYIFIDSPPVGIVTDASILSQFSDGVVFVVSSGEVELDFAKLAKEKLINVDAKILGAVLNKYESANQDYGYYYGEYYGQKSKKGWLKKLKSIGQKKHKKLKTAKV